MVKLVLVSAQGFFLQYTILYFMTMQLVAKEEDEANPMAESSERLIVIVAVYLHIVNCMTGLPFGATTLYHFHTLKDTWLEVLVVGPIFFIDSMVTPISTIIVGSLYLCRADCVSAVILNSCAIAFIGNIDNWILTLNLNMNKMGGNIQEHTLYVPHSKNTMKVLNIILCVVPIVPAALALLMVHLGLDVLRL